MAFPLYDSPRWQPTKEGLIVPSEMSHFTRTLDRWAQECRRWGKEVDASIGAFNPAVIASIQADVLALQGDMTAVQGDVADLQDGTVRPWGAMWGVVASAAIPAVTGITTSQTDIVTVTATLVPGRRYRLAANGRFSVSGVSQRGIVTLANSANVEIGRLADDIGAGSNRPVVAEGWAWITGSGSTMFKLRAGLAAGASGTIQSVAVGELTVEDTGPV